MPNARLTATAIEYSAGEFLYAAKKPQNQLAKDKLTKGVIDFWFTLEMVN